MVPKDADWEQFCAHVERSLALTATQGKNAPVTIEKGRQIIRSLVHLRNVEQVRRDQRFGTSEDQRSIGAWLRDQFQRCTGQGR